MKKAVFIIPRLGSGGAERVMATIANNLSKDHEVDIITITSAESFYQLHDNVNVKCINCTIRKNGKFNALMSKIQTFLKTYTYLLHYIKVDNPDVIVSFLQETNIIVLLTKLFKNYKARVIVSERADPNRRNAAMRFFERHYYKRADYIVCQSKPVVNFFINTPIDKLVIIPNPICRDAIPDYYSGERRKTIVAVGRLFPQKNFKLLIKSFANLDKKYDDYSLEIYGSGYLEKELLSLIDELKVQDKVFLMGNQRNVMHYISDCSLFVLSSDFEGMPNVLLEAMASGLPVITTDFSPVGVAKELVEEKNGIIVPTNNEIELTKAIEFLLGHKEIAKEMSIENTKILNVYSESIIVKKWEQVMFE